MFKKREDNGGTCDAIFASAGSASISNKRV